MRFALAFLFVLQVSRGSKFVMSTTPFFNAVGLIDERIEFVEAVL